MKIQSAMRSLSGFSALTLLLVLQSACSTLPSAAPTSRQVSIPATLADGRTVEVIDLTQSGWPKNNERKALRDQWDFTDGDPVGGAILPGDRLDIVIFEIGYTLFGNAGGAAQNSARDRPVAAAGNALPQIEVPVGGEITLPYIGRINVLGRSGPSVAAEVKRRMRGLSQQAEILVSVSAGPVRSVTISGNVKSPGRQGLTIAGERLLDIVAQAGGPTEQPANIFVRLTRGGISDELRLDRIFAEDSANVRLIPGDSIQLVKSSRTMTVIGAAKNVSEVAIDNDNLTLIEALARAGGPIDTQADAKGVFVFRFVEKEANGEAIWSPTIYRLNMLDPRSYFIASQFEMHDDDVVLIANSRSAQFGKLVQLLNQFTSPIVTADLLTRSVK
jgi:polysaccharide biosynthesis/export protein